MKKYLLILVLLVGCSSSKETPKVYNSCIGVQNSLELGDQNRVISVTNTIKMDSGQKVVLLNNDDLGKWLENHKKAHIDAALPEVRSGWLTGKTVLFYTQPEPKTEKE